MTVLCSEGREGDGRRTRDILRTCPEVGEKIWTVRYDIRYLSPLGCPLEAFFRTTDRSSRASEAGPNLPQFHISLIISDVGISASSIFTQIWYLILNFRTVQSLILRELQRGIFCVPECKS